MRRTKFQKAVAWTLSGLLVITMVASALTFLF